MAPHKLQVRNGAGQQNVQLIDANLQNALRREKKAAQQPGTQNPMYAQHINIHEPKDIHIRSKSRILLDGSNNDSLPKAICDFVNLPDTEAFYLIVKSIYLMDKGYSFVQEQLGVTIPDPEKNFSTLLRELAHQFRIKNKQPDFFKDSHTLPEQKDHPITVAYSALCFNDDNNDLETICARILVYSACKYYINSNEGPSIGRVWYLLSRDIVKSYHGGLCTIFNPLYPENENESIEIALWLHSKHIQVFNLFKAILTQEKPEIAANLAENPSYYHNIHINVQEHKGEHMVPSELPFTFGEAFTIEETNAHENVVVDNHGKNVKKSDIYAHPEAFGQFCTAHNSIMSAGIEPKVLVSYQEAIDSYLAKSAVIDSFSGIHDILANRTQITEFFEVADALAKSGIDPEAIVKNRNNLTAFFDTVKALSCLGFNIPNILEKATKIKEMLASADDEL